MSLGSFEADALIRSTALDSRGDTGMGNVGPKGIAGVTINGAAIPGAQWSARPLGLQARRLP
jgi:hypothetical protein